MNRFLILTLFFAGVILLAACGNSQNAADAKIYNIPEIDKLTVEIAKNPKSAALYAARSLVFSEKEMMKEAEIDAEKALQLDSTKVDYYRLLGNAYFDNFHSHDAIKVLQKAIGRFPQEAKLYLILAEMQMLVEQYKDCIYTIDMLYKIAPENPEGMFLQGQVFRLTGDSLKAIEIFEKVVARDADHVSAYMELALYTNKKGDPVTLKYLENVLRIDSMHEGALLTRAQYYHFRSEYTEAIKQYENGIVKHPQSSDLNYNLGLMYLEMGDNIKSNKDEAAKYYGSSLRHFDNSTKFDLQFADAYYYKAIAAERLGKKDLAVRDYENAMRLQAYLETVSPITVEKALYKLK